MGTFNDDVLDYGPDVAFAAQTVDDVINQLQGSDEVLARVVRKSFDMISEEEKLDLFKDLYNLLSKADQESISTHGL